jgi:hypothetical protein
MFGEMVSELQFRKGQGRVSARLRNPDLAGEWREMREIVDGPIPIVPLHLAHDWQETQ